MGDQAIKTKRWLFVSAFVLIAALLFVPMTSVSHVVGEQCWYTLSARGHTEWPFGIESSHWIRPSPLEEYLVENAPEQLEHDWHHLYKTGRTVYGDSTVFHNYRSSPAIRLHSAILSRWIDESSREEVLAFHELLKSDDRDQIETKVEEILATSR